MDIYAFGICALEMAVVDIQGNGETKKKCISREAVLQAVEGLKDDSQRVSVTWSDESGIPDESGLPGGTIMWEGQKGKTPQLPPPISRLYLIRFNYCLHGQMSLSYRGKQLWGIDKS